MDCFERDEEKVVMVQLPSQALSVPSEASISTAETLVKHYREVRNRLRYPPNAVPDAGIHCKQKAAIHLFDQTLKSSFSGVKIELEPEPEPEPSPIIVHVPIIVPIPDPVLTGVTFSSTVALAAEEFGLTEQLIHSRTRKAPICRARQIAIYLAFNQKRWSISWIAHRFKVDHTTALHAIRRIQFLMAQDDELRQRVEALEAKVALLNSSPLPADDEPSLGEAEEGDVSQPDLSTVDQGG